MAKNSTVTVRIVYARNVVNLVLTPDTADELLAFACKDHVAVSAQFDRTDARGRRFCAEVGLKALAVYVPGHDETVKGDVDFMQIVYDRYVVDLQLSQDESKRLSDFAANARAAYAQFRGADADGRRLRVEVGSRALAINAVDDR